MPAKKRIRPWLPLVTLLLLASGCAHNSPHLPETAPDIPVLPQEARQPKPPPECSPSCSEGLTRLRSEWLDMLMKLGSPEPPASAPTTR